MRKIVAGHCTCNNCCKSVACLTSSRCTSRLHAGGGRVFQALRTLRTKAMGPNSAHWSVCWQRKRERRAAKTAPCAQTIGNVQATTIQKRSVECGTMHPHKDVTAAGPQGGRQTYRGDSAKRVRGTLDLCAYNATRVRVYYYYLQRQLKTVRGLVIMLGS